ncbi:hypothetical protein BC834DRAFT_871962 [Gloeopeniophorella convolvens]|nr:hypothetical protein BC834DRAFT_871962 [Gloeopeniophorella convolvens]
MNNIRCSVHMSQMPYTPTKGHEKWETSTPHVRAVPRGEHARTHKTPRGKRARPIPTTTAQRPRRSPRTGAPRAALESGPRSESRPPRPALAGPRAHARRGAPETAPARPRTPDDGPPPGARGHGGARAWERREDRAHCRADAVPSTMRVGPYRAAAAPRGRARLLRCISVPSRGARDAAQLLGTPA